MTLVTHRQVGRLVAVYIQCEASYLSYVSEIVWYTGCYECFCACVGAMCGGFLRGVVVCCVGAMCGGFNEVYLHSP